MEDDKKMKTALSWLSLVLILQSKPAICMPISDTVLVNGREWAQLTSFTNFSWNEINEVCPSGDCSGGVLANTPLDGWSWASATEVGELFNFFVGANVFSVPNAINLPGTEVFDLVATLGFEESSFNNYAGWTSSVVANQIGEQAIGAAIRLFGDATVGFTQNIRTSFDAEKDLKSENVGVWLFREPAMVSSPGTLLLVVFAAAIFSSRKSKYV